jgi:uncharacterized protein YjbJ (UPF0337 family)
MQTDPKKDHTDEPIEEDEKPMSGFAQFIVGELETIGGVLTGDPLTQAEGEFNVEVGTVRDDLEDAADDEKDEDAE